MHSIPQARTFVNLICGEDTPVFQTCLDDKNRTDRSTFRAGSLDSQLPWLKGAQAGGHGVFLTINRTEGARKAANVTKVRALFVEFDHGEEPAAWHLEPSITVQSGNGKHVYWLLSEDMPVEDFTPSVKRLIAHYGSDPKIHDPSRVLRLPGSIHQKAKKGETPKPYDVTLLTSPGHRYTIAQILEGIPAAVSAPRKERHQLALVKGSELEQALADARTWKAGVAKDEGGAGRDKFKACARVVNDYTLTEDEQMLVAQEWNKRCTPPLDDDELEEQLMHARSHTKGFVSPEVRQRERDNTDWSSSVQVLKVRKPAEKAATASAPLEVRQPRKQGAQREDSASVSGILNDKDVAMLTIEDYTDKIMYVTEQNCWYIWTGKVWKKDIGTKIVEGYVIQTLTNLEGISGGDKKRQAACRLYMNHKYATSAIKTMETRAEVTVSQEMLDSYPHLLSHAEGTVNLLTGEMHPHDPKDYLTKCLSFAPKKDASSRWHAFLDQTFEDKELLAYVQRAIGCSTIGGAGQDKWFMCTGTGGNGKGTFLEAIANALQGYAALLPDAFFLQTPFPAHPTELMDLRGARFARSGEISAQSTLDENRLKALSGGDPIKARGMNQDFTTFQATHTLWLQCNEKPRVRSTDKGFWRRAAVIPFNLQLSSAQRDPTVRNYMKSAEAAPVVLAWILDGVRMYQQDGLGTSEAVDKETAEYRGEQDFFGTMLKELCEIGDTLYVPKAALREAITLYYAAAGMEKLAPNDVYVKRHLRALGMGDDKEVKTKAFAGRVWIGLGLKPDVVVNMRRESIPHR